ncbi:MAG: DUF1295 domain-containing protein [Candidatus Woesearchaeota archaeon]
MELWYALASVYTVVILWYIIAYKYNDVSIIDLLWGPLFLFLGGVIYVFTPSVALLGVLLLLLVWATRLTVHIAQRKTWGQEDFRYEAMKKKWRYPFFDGLFRVYTFQFLLAVVMATPLLFVSFSVWYVLGVLVWIVGFGIEVLADTQLRDHKKHGHGILQKGLWKTWRHPNYVGESLMWWGIWLTALPLGWWTIISPVAITLLLRFVSIPLLEKKYERNVAYEQYKKKARIFF